jgi:hypothetical protein
MAQSTCIKCGSTRFEKVLNTPSDSTYKHHFIQCSGCGGVVGVVEFYDIGALLHLLARKLDVELLRSRYALQLGTRLVSVGGLGMNRRPCPRLSTLVDSGAV